MRKYQVTLDDETRAVLERSTITETSLTLPPGRLERALYQKVNKVLTTAGGKWHTGRQAHLFPSDPRQVLGLALQNGAIKDEKKANGVFYTPEDLALRVIQLAEIEPGQRVLEPSAGRGALADAAERAGGKLFCIEIDPESVRVLQGKCHTTLCLDFLKVPVRKTEMYPRIVMNPPFNDGADIRHINHARSMLAPGGRLVAICADGTKQQAKLKPEADEWIELPPGSFKESGTNVRAAICVFNA